MELEIDPEPSEAVRKAILASLAEVERPPAESLWWRAGVAESAADEADQAAARPRRSAGAERA